MWIGRWIYQLVHLIMNYRWIIDASCSKVNIPPHTHMHTYMAYDRPLTSKVYYAILISLWLFSKLSKFSKFINYINIADSELHCLHVDFSSFHFPTPCSQLKKCKVTFLNVNKHFYPIRVINLSGWLSEHWWVLFFLKRFRD